MSIVLRSEDGGIRQCPTCLTWTSWRADLFAGAGYPEPVWVRKCDRCGEWQWA